MKPEHVPAQALPDSRGINLFSADPSFAGLLGLYLGDDLRRHLAPHFARLGALAGGELDQLVDQRDRVGPGQQLVVLGAEMAGRQGCERQLVV